MAEGVARMEKAVDEILANFPARPLAWLLRLIVPGDAKARRGAADDLLLKAAALITEPGPARDRLTLGVFLPDNDDGVARLERAFALTIAADPVHRRLRQAKLKDWRKAHADGLVSDGEAQQLEAAEQAVDLAAAVDDFAPGTLEPNRASKAAAKPAKGSASQRRTPLPAAPPSI